MPLALEDAHIGAAEGRVAERVAHGVDGAVDVAQVVEEVPQARGDAVRTRRERLEQHQDVVRRPSKNKGEQNSTQCFSSLLFSLLFLCLLLLLGLLVLAATEIGKDRPRP